MSTDFRMAPSGRARGGIRGSRASGRNSIGRLSRNETDNGLLNIDVGNTEDDDCEGRNDEEESGEQNHGHSTAFNSSINSVINGEKEKCK